MRFNPTRLASALLLCALTATTATSALAQGFPNKPIRMVVTFPAGGAPDILSRLFADKAQLGQPVVVDNVAATSAPTAWPRPLPTATRW